jgi:choline-sulfatase
LTSIKTPLKSDNQNILIIISDEHRKDAMGCAGHPIVKTPNLDKWRSPAIVDTGLSWFSSRLVVPSELGRASVTEM